MIKNILTPLFLFFSFCLLGQDFEAIWNTNNTETGSSTTNQITIPTNPAYTTYNYTVDWGDTSTDTGVTGNITHDYGAPGTYTIKISGTFPAIYFNDNNASDKLKIIEILDWGNIQWQTMENAFFGCANLNFDAISSPDLSQVTSLKNMFREGTLFNGIINNWDTSTITDISGMFYDARVFNRPLDTWTTSSITDMSETFYSASSFNEPLDSWNIGAVTTMARMFDNARKFNQNINNWNVTQVTNMTGTFSDTNDFNTPLNNWDVSNVTDMSYMFDDSGFNQPIDRWNVGKVTNMSHMFSNAKFNQPIDSWNVALVEDMSYMFQRHRTFNQPLNNWNVGNVTNMAYMFDGYYWTEVFNQPLNNWDVSKVTDMSYMFRDTEDFNQNISSWNVSEVTNMTGMFNIADNFNQDISSWNVSKVTLMTNMFQRALVFDQPLDNWNVSNVTNFSGMFNGAALFNQPLNTWIVTNATSMTSMFNGAALFNQPLNDWSPLLVTSMSSMFNNASAFDQNLASWNITSVTNMASMLSSAGLSQENYDNLLIGWAAQTVNSNVNLGATNLNYCDGLGARQQLIDTNNWTFSGDIVNCSYVLCTQITSPYNGDQNVPANSSIRWEAAPNATGYRVSIRREDDAGNVLQVIANNEDFGNVLLLNFTNEFLVGDNVFVTVVPYNGEGPAVDCQEISFKTVASWVNSPDAFKLTYDTSLLNSSWTTPANQLEIRTRSGLTYDYSIDWGDGQYDNNVTGGLTHTYLNPGIYTVSIIGTFPAPKHDEFSDAFKLISIDQWGTQTWLSMQGAFAGCENMEYNATDIPILSSVTDMSRMFIVCKKFDGDINSWNVSNVTNMYAMFGVATIFNQPLNTWDVSKVTDMSLMFFRTDAFNQDLNTWNTGLVTNMSRMFEDAEAFNGAISNWDVSSVTEMAQMFQRTEVFNQPINSWNVSNVTDMSQMFNSAKVFNQDIDSWTVSAVTDMEQMFSSAVEFNQPLNSWNVAAVTTMSSMFSSATAFNQPLGSWNVSSVNNMSNMFRRAENFDQPINSWNVATVTNMSGMFSSATAFNNPLQAWNVSRVVSMNSMFYYATSFNQPIQDWNVNSVVNMSSMFSNAENFNQPLNLWNVSAVANMSSMFESTLLFDQNLNSWDVSSVTLMPSMFETAEAFNGTISNWNVASVTTMKEMFRDATDFNQNIDPWDVSFVRTMESMFEDAVTYDQTMNSWNVASVTTMEDMFNGATLFNGTIDAWNVRGVTTMYEMFKDATTFNQSVNNWRVAGVSDMGYMFNGATSYNQSMNLWNLGSVSMRSTFYNATALNQNLGDWDVSGVSDMRDMLDNTALIRENYDNTLIAWSEQTLNSGITLGAEGLPYCDGQEERQAMIDNFGWTFSLDVRDCPIPECTLLASPLNGDVDVPVNTNITWEPALFAQGYYLTVGTTSGGNDVLNNVTITNETSYEFASDFNTGDVVYVTIIPFNDEGDAVGPCTEENFTISNDLATIPECTNITQPTLPANDVVVTSDLSWNPISNADGYKLTIGTSSGANDILNAENVGNVITYDLATNLPENSDIFITITPYNDEGDAASCTEENFHTELIPVPPTCTSLTLPLNGANDVAIDTHLSWTAIPNATGYLVIVGTTSDGIEVVNNIDNGNLTTYDIPVDLQEGRLHYVTIIPYNDEGDATGCIEETFTTGDSTSPPSCTMLTAPINDAMAVDPSTNLTWTELASATGYKLSIGTSSGSSDIFTDDVSNVLTYDLAANLPESTTIYVTVTPYNDNGDAIGCAEETFTTDGLPLCTSLATPVNGATNIAIDTNIEWNASSNTDGYKLTVTASNSTANNLTDFDVTTGTTYDFANDFERGETVTVTIIPYNAVGNATGPCTSESFIIIPPPVPTCTTLMTPVNGAIDVALDTNLEWNASTGTDGYKLTVLASSSTANNVTDVDITSGTTYNFSTDFEQGETVAVTIVPYNSVGDAIGCTSESFTIKPVPACTNLIAPTNSAIDVAIDTNLEWTPVAEATGYKLTVTGSSSSTNNLTDFETTASTYNFLNNLEQGETVTVTIVPYNEIGDAIGCSSETFTIKPVPSCTNLTLPNNGTIDIAVDTNIQWTAIPEATGYKLSVTGSNSTDNNLTDFDTTTTTYSFLNDFEQGETVTVTILPYNEVGDAIGCTSETFTIKPLPICTNLIAPLNNAVVTEISEITWNTATNADGYKLSITGSTTAFNNETDLIVTGNTHAFSNDFSPGEIVTVTIIPYNEVGDAIGCTSESFTVRPIPPCTNLISPLNNATEVSVMSDVSWNTSNDADGYRISVGTSPNGTDIVNGEDVASLTSYTFAEDLPSETLIYVSIVPYNTSGVAVGCTTENFETEIIIPECSQLSTPYNGETDVDLENTISWEAVEKIDGYRLSLGTTPGDTDILDNQDMGNATSYTHNQEYPFGTDIYVTITPYNSKGSAEQCEQQSFTTLTPEDDTKYGFSPDGDGVNDYWHIDNIEYYPENIVMIYSRWGDAVFEIKNYDNNSAVFRGDANLKTKMGAGRLPSGTYFFNIQVEGETILRKTKGYIVIKR